MQSGPCQKYERTYVLIEKTLDDKTLYKCLEREGGAFCQTRNAPPLTQKKKSIDRDC